MNDILESLKGKIKGVWTAYSASIIETQAGDVFAHIPLNVTLLQTVRFFFGVELVQLNGSRINVVSLQCGGDAQIDP